MRKITHLVKVGKVNIGGNSPIVVQSMTDTDTADIKKTVSQIEELYNSGSELIRVTVNNAESAKSIKTIKEHCAMPERTLKHGARGWSLKGGGD